MTPYQAYLYAQRVAQREVNSKGISGIVPAQRTLQGGWWTPMFPTVYLHITNNFPPAPRAKRRD